MCVITNEKATLLRNVITPNVRGEKEQSYRYPRGTTAVLKEQLIQRKEMKKYITIVDLSGKPQGTVEGDAMEVDA